MVYINLIPCSLFMAVGNQTHTKQKKYFQAWRTILQSVSKEVFPLKDVTHTG